jgi:hypothetical protein
VNENDFSLYFFAVCLTFYPIQGNKSAFAGAAAQKGALGLTEAVQSGFCCSPLPASESCLASK